MEPTHPRRRRRLPFFFSTPLAMLQDKPAAKSRLPEARRRPPLRPPLPSNIASGPSDGCTHLLVHDLSPPCHFVQNPPISRRVACSWMDGRVRLAAAGCCCCCCYSVCPCVPGPGPAHLSCSTPTVYLPRLIRLYGPVKRRDVRDRPHARVINRRDLRKQHEPLNRVGTRAHVVKLGPMQAT